LLPFYYQLSLRRANRIFAGTTCDAREPRISCAAGRTARAGSDQLTILQIETPVPLPLFALFERCRHAFTAPSSARNRSAVAVTP
jgi:hypothetical protein